MKLAKGLLFAYFLSSLLELFPVPNLNIIVIFGARLVLHSWYFGSLPDLAFLVRCGDGGKIIAEFFISLFGFESTL